ncbi:hypothetical protein Tco_0238165 [Tanacetum coccineum]
MSAKDSITTQTCELSQEEFNEFLALYPVPSEYHVILPKSNQTIFDAPPGYVRLYTHSFSLANLRLPFTEFFCEVLEYFQVHISRLNLFGSGKWLTFAKRSEKHIPNLLPKVITRIEGWHERFFYVQDSIIPAKYPQLLSEQDKLDLKSFKDKLPPNIEENPMFQRLSRRGKVYNWETATYGKIWCNEDVHDLRSVETEFPAIVFDDAFTSEPTVSPLNEIKLTLEYQNDNDKVNMPSFSSSNPTVSCIDDLDFFKEFKNEFPAIIYNDALTSKLDFLTEPTVSTQHIDKFNLKDDTSLYEFDEEE